jgi:hypothetical protein
MKYISTSIGQKTKLPTVAAHRLIPAMAGTLRDLMALMSAVLIATVIITLAVWMAGLQFNGFLAASTWALGFTFLAMAIDRHGRLAFLQVATGGSLFTLALLQNSVSPDFGILTGILVAVWVAVALYRRLSNQVR